MNSVWILEMRGRTRKNGNWSTWELMEPFRGPFTAHREPPSFATNSDYIQYRPVEYKRVEPEASR